MNAILKTRKNKTSFTIKIVDIPDEYDFSAGPWEDTVSFVVGSNQEILPLASEYFPKNFFLIIPEYEFVGEKYPGDIRPGCYSASELIEFIRYNDDKLLTKFINDMIEE